MQHIPGPVLYTEHSFAITGKPGTSYSLPSCYLTVRRQNGIKHEAIQSAAPGRRSPRSGQEDCTIPSFSETLKSATLPLHSHYKSELIPGLTKCAQ